MEMFRRQLEEVELAERIGIDQIWFFEHHLQPTAPVPSPNLLIAAAARTTQRIRFTSMVNILPFRHPLLVAEEAAMLDNLTGGRFDMGLGTGSGARSRACVLWPPSPMIPSTGMDGMKMAQGSTMSSAHDATRIPTCC
jgi:alkanesulfonate monooxygenase SsuD/methylene tetrahydromethanopterin reductase-like flavin-dependent oxidoreductase (luciferase family)